MVVPDWDSSTWAYLTQSLRAERDSLRDMLESETCLPGSVDLLRGQIIALNRVLALPTRYRRLIEAAATSPHPPGLLE